jgi:hypothetical protein
VAAAAVCCSNNDTIVASEGKNAIISNSFFILDCVSVA